MIWADILSFLMAIFSSQADGNNPELLALQREADREAARERSRKAAGI